MKLTKALITNFSAYSDLSITFKLFRCFVLYAGSEEGTFTITTVGTEENEIQYNFLTLSNYPNPFSTSTSFKYELKQPEKITLMIYDYLGKQVYQARDNKSQGLQKIMWNAEGLPDGIYYYRLQIGKQFALGKMVKTR